MPGWHTSFIIAAAGGLIVGQKKEFRFGGTEALLYKLVTILVTI